MKVSSKVTFILGIVISICLGIGQGVIHLTDVVPASWIPYITGWAGLISTVTSIVMTALAGVSTAVPGPLAPAPTIREAQSVMESAKAALPK